MPEHKIDHEAAKEWAREIAALKAELSRAVELLQRFEKFYGKPTPTLRDDVHDFLAERGGE